MKSTSGNDGSYTLTVSFALGTDPDQNTVNVNNRVQLAVARLPQEVQQQGLSVKKKSSAMLQVISLRSTAGGAGPAVHQQLRHDQHPGRGQARSAGVGDALMLGPLDYSMRIWFETDRLTGLGLTPGDIVAAIQRQNRVAPVGRIGAQPISDDAAFQLNIRTQGRLVDAGGVRQHRRPRQPGRVGAARPRRGAAGARRRHPRRRDPDQRAPGDPHRHLPRAGRQCGRRRRGAPSR